MSGITAAQYDVLMRPIRSSRIAHRSQGGKRLSYLESYDVRGHLIRVFGFANFDVEVDSEQHIGDREYDSKDGKPMVEVMWKAGVTLKLRAADGTHLATYRECAVGATSGPAHMIGEHHDNALKTAASDALKRCAINLGSQFGLSLYDNGSTAEIIRNTVITPTGVTNGQDSGTQGQSDPAKDKRIEESLGAQVNPTEEGQHTNEAAVGEAEAAPGGDDGSQGAAGEQS